MPITQDMEWPLEKTIISGPGVDALEQRKETGRLTPVTTAELRESLMRVKDRRRIGATAAATIGCLSMVTNERLLEWEYMALHEDCCTRHDCFVPGDIRQMLGEIERLRAFEALAKETGIFHD